MNNFLEYFVIRKISNFTSFTFKDIINTQQNIIPAAIIINLSSILLIIYGFAGFFIKSTCYVWQSQLLDNYTTIQIDQGQWSNQYFFKYQGLFGNKLSIFLLISSFQINISLTALRYSKTAFLCYYSISFQFTGQCQSNCARSWSIAQKEFFKSLATAITLFFESYVGYQLLCSADPCIIVNNYCQARAIKFTLYSILWIITPRYLNIIFQFVLKYIHISFICFTFLFVFISSLYFFQLSLQSITYAQAQYLQNAKILLYSNFEEKPSFYLILNKAVAKRAQLAERPHEGTDSRIWRTQYTNLLEAGIDGLKIWILPAVQRILKGGRFYHFSGNIYTFWGNGCNMACSIPTDSNSKCFERFHQRSIETISNSLIRWWTWNVDARHNAQFPLIQYKKPLRFMLHLEQKCSQSVSQYNRKQQQKNVMQQFKKNKTFFRFDYQNATPFRQEFLSQDQFKSINLKWFSKLEDLVKQDYENKKKGKDIPLTIFIMNQFFDALPITILQYTLQGWRQKVLKLSTNPQLPFILQNSSMQPHSKLIPNIATPKIGDRLQISPQSFITMDMMAKMIKLTGGAILNIDYGGNGPFVDSIRAIKNHKFIPAPYYWQIPGACDLSAHVAFSSLAQYAQKVEGVKAFQLVPQQFFLEAMGIQTRFQTLAKNLNKAKLQRLQSEVRRLTSPQQMGELFKVQIIALKQYGEIYPHVTYNPGVF